MFFGMMRDVRIKQSVCFPIFRSAFPSLDELFAAVAATGYRAVEFWAHRGLSADEEFAVADVAAQAARHGLAVASFSGHASLPDGCNDPANHDRIEAELRASIELAAAHGVPGLICFSGNRLHGQSDYEGLVECARLMRRVAPHAEQHGVNLNMELLNSKVNHPDYLADRSDWGLALCEMVRSPRVKLLYDIYHMQIMEGDVIRSIRRLLPLIGHFHTAGNPGAQRARRHAGVELPRHLQRDRRHRLRPVRRPRVQPDRRPGRVAARRVCRV